jgi:hypothetical protein
VSDDAMKFRAGEEWVGCFHLGVMMPAKDWPGCAECDAQAERMFPRVKVASVDVEGGTTTITIVPDA